MVFYTFSALFLFIKIGNGFFFFWSSLTVWLHYYFSIFFYFYFFFQLRGFVVFFFFFFSYLWFFFIFFWVLPSSFLLIFYFILLYYLSLFHFKVYKNFWIFLVFYSTRGDHEASLVLVDFLFQNLNFFYLGSFFNCINFFYFIYFILFFCWKSSFIKPHRALLCIIYL